MVPPKYFITTSPLFIMKHTEEQRVVMEKPLVRWREYRCLVLPSDLTWWPLEPAGTCWLQHLWRGCCELLVDNMLGNTALMRPQQVILEFPGTSYQAGACLCWRGAYLFRYVPLLLRVELKEGRRDQESGPELWASGASSAWVFMAGVIPLFRAPS